ncbi:putative pentatricopeptide repeat-containing protein At1g16830 isoform X2 [Cryptomeria japonica]|uniref:putative pentatricopeptide repeat-containing protein At1g16830 isoform X2 n=1 Tax=Cryptomeria japonica TaxID=3369 RepID=UPI0025ABA058|nr:putative pentatricopeptide repeat-containing protein At1g16830 isoform X2 [Cryptomeria japonica]
MLQINSSDPSGFKFQRTAGFRVYPVRPRKLPNQRWGGLQTEQMILFGKLFRRIHRRFVLKPDNSHFLHTQTSVSNNFEQKGGKISPEILSRVIAECPSDIMALNLFIWFGKQKACKPSSHSYDHMVGVMRRIIDKNGNANAIVEELRDIGCVMSVQTAIMLLRIYSHAGMVEEALETIKQMHSFGCMTDILAQNLILDVFFKTNQVNMASSAFGSIRFPNFFTFTTAIDGYCKAGSMYEAQRVLKVMISKGQVEAACNLFCSMERSGSIPTVVTYTCLVKGFWKAGMFSRALEVWDAMVLKGYVPDVVSYNILIHCFCKEDRHGDAITLFNEMQKRGLKPDSVTFSSLVSVLCKSGKFFCALELFTKGDFEMDIIACNSLLSGLCKAGHLSKALDLYKNMLANGYALDRYTYSALMTGLLRAGREMDAISLHELIIRNSLDFDPHGHTILFDHLMKIGEVNKAMKLFRRTLESKCSVDVVAFTVIICGLFKAGRPEDARELYNQMCNSGVVPNCYTYNVLLDGFCKARDIEAAKKIFDKMHSAGFGPDTVSFNTLINFLCKSGLVHLASDLFMKMLEFGFVPNEITYGLLVDGLCSAGRPDDAYKLLVNHLEFHDYPVSSKPDSNDINNTSSSIMVDSTKKGFSSKPILSNSTLQRLFERVQIADKEK